MSGGGAVEATEQAEATEHVQASHPGRKSNPAESYKGLWFGLSLAAAGGALVVGFLGTSVLLGSLLRPLFEMPIAPSEVVTYVLLGPFAGAVAAWAYSRLPKDGASPSVVISNR